MAAPFASQRRLRGLSDIWRHGREWWTLRGAGLPQAARCMGLAAASRRAGLLRGAGCMLLVRFGEVR